MDTNRIERTLGSFLAAVLLLGLALQGTSEAADLFEKYDGKNVKVFVSPVKDTGGKGKVDPALLRSRLEDALRARKSIRFEVLQSPEQAELLIDTDIRDFMWTDHDPVDMITGLTGTAADALIVEDYAKLQADVRVTQAATSKVVWQERVRATVTKKPMSEAESVPLVVEDFAKTFIRDCFGKKKKGYK